MITSMITRIEKASKKNGSLTVERIMARRGIYRKNNNDIIKNI